MLLKKIVLGICLFFCVGCFYSLAFADTLVLKSGQVVDGKIIENTAKYVKINFDGVELTFFQDEIASINQGKVDSAAGSGLSSLYEAFKSGKNAVEDKESIAVPVTPVKPDNSYVAADTVDVNVTAPQAAGGVNSPETMQDALSKLPKEYQEMIKSKLQSLQVSNSANQTPNVPPNDLSSLPPEYQQMIKSSLEKLPPNPQETKN